MNVNRNFVLTYDYPKARVYAAAIKTIDSLSGMKVKQADEAAGYISVNVGMSLFSWGESLTIMMRESGENKCDIEIGSASKAGVIDYGKNQKNIDSIIKGISSILKS